MGKTTNDNARFNPANTFETHLVFSVKCCANIPLLRGDVCLLIQSFTPCQRCPLDIPGTYEPKAVKPGHPGRGQSVPGQFWIAPRKHRETVESRKQKGIRMSDMKVKTLFVAGATLIAALLFVLAANPFIVAGSPDDPPERPTGLTGTVEHDQVALAWDDRGDQSISGYQILRRNRAIDGPGVFHVHVEDTGSAATSYTDNDVEAETFYVYRIKARNAAGLSSRSSYFNARTPAAPQPPVKPTGLTGTVAHDQVALTWNDPGDDTITGYQILRRIKAVDDPGVFHVHVDDTGSAATSYTDTGVAAETFYVYRVKARNSGGLSPQSSYFNANTPEDPSPKKPTPEQERQRRSASPPAAPSLMATALSPDGDVIISWRQDPGDDTISGYRILRGDSEETLAEIVSDTETTDTTYTDTEPPAGQTLHYAVQARNASGLSEPSNTLSVTTPEEEEEPVASEHNENDHGGDLFHDKIHISNFTRWGTVTTGGSTSPVHRMRVTGNANSGFTTRATFLAHGVAQQFRTGSASAGYDLGIVRLGLNGLSGYAIPEGGSARDRNIPIVSIWSSASGNPKTPAARLHTLVNSRNLGQHINDFYGVDVHLAANTDYFLVVENYAAIDAYEGHGIGIGSVFRTGDVEVTTTPGFGRPANLKAFTIDVIQKRTENVDDSTDHNPSDWGIRSVKLDRFFQRTGVAPEWCVALPNWASNVLGSKLGSIGNTGCNANFTSNGNGRPVLRMAMFAPLDASEPFFENFDGHGGADPVVLRVPEDAEPGSVVGTIPVHSLDGDTVTISMSGASAGFAATFAVNAQTGAVTLRPGASLDHEGTTPRFTADLSVTDGEDAAGSTETTPTIDDSTTLTIEVTDVDEPGEFTFVSNRQLDPATDRPVAGETITVTFDDPDGPLEFNSWIYRCGGAADTVRPPDGTSVLTYSFTPQTGDWQCNSWMLVDYRDQHGPQVENVLFLNRVERPPSPSE